MAHPSAAAHPSSRGPPCQVRNENGGGAACFHAPAKYVESSCCPCPRMLTENPCAVCINRPRWAFLPTQKSTSGGSSESDVNAFAVIALMVPSTSVAMTVTPVTKRPTVCRHGLESTH